MVSVFGQACFQEPKAEDINADVIASGRELFSGPSQFFFGTLSAENLPDANFPEIAFAGRSNVGKSTLINALTNQSKLARVSKNPGCTRQINFFSLPSSLWLVDLPGYGFAKVSKDNKRAWNHLIELYLRERPTLRRVLLLIDSRRGINKSDKNIMGLLEKAAVVFEIVLTKIDEINQSEQAKAISVIKNQIEGFTNSFPRIIMTSSRKKIGIDILRGEVALIARQS